MIFPTYTFIDVLISVVLAFIMLGVGLSLTYDSFKNIFLHPKALLIGLSSQLIVLPLFAFIISYFSYMSIPLKVGLIILATSSGGTTSGFLAYLFKGNVALSITFTSINSIITLFTIPFIVNLSLLFYFGHTSDINLSYLESIIQIFSVTIVPAIIGAFIRNKFPLFADKAQHPLKLLLITALALVFIIKVFVGPSNGGSGITIKDVLIILPYAILLNVLCMSWGFILGIITKLGYKNAYTIGIEASVLNTTIAFLVAGTLLQNQEMVKPSLIYAMFSFWTAIIYTYIIKKKHGVKFLADFKS